jgi:hypothetical protein
MTLPPLIPPPLIETDDECMRVVGRIAFLVKAIEATPESKELTVLVDAVMRYEDKFHNREKLLAILRGILDND